MVVVKVGCAFLAIISVGYPLDSAIIVAPTFCLPSPHSLPPYQTIAYSTAFPPAAPALPRQRPYTPPAGGVSLF